MRALSVFSGAGGLDLAAESAGIEVVGQIEFDPACNKVLRYHWPDVARWEDVRDVRGADVIERCGPIDIVFGGFPCQPHSVAGKRQASGDERDLWPELARLIREVGPRWVVGENVPGLLTSEDGRFFGGVLRDLAAMGYDASWGVWGAADVGALHERERLFIAAHTNRRMGKTRHRILEKHQRPVQRKDQTQCFGSLRAISEAGKSRGNDGAGGRVDRLRMLGNMVCPQQAAVLFGEIVAQDIKGGRHE